MALRGWLQQRWMSRPLRQHRPLVSQSSTPPSSRSKRCTHGNRSQAQAVQGGTDERHHCRASSRTLDETEYHSPRALSSTGARRLLESPAKFRYMQDHPEPPKREFDVGSAVHAKVLGVGAQITVIPTGILASNGPCPRRSEAVRRGCHGREGLIPVKQGVADEINAMVEAVLGHPSGPVPVRTGRHPGSIRVRY
jgi:hypothetical protein